MQDIKPLKLLGAKVTLIIAVMHVALIIQMLDGFTEFTCFDLFRV